MQNIYKELNLNIRKMKFVGLFSLNILNILNIFYSLQLKNRMVRLEVDNLILKDNLKELNVKLDNINKSKDTFYI